jgi:hypothetical protein
MGKPFCFTHSNLLAVDEEDYYSDEDDHEPLVMDELDDNYSLANEDDR